MKKSKRCSKKRVKRKTIRKYKGGDHDFYLLSSKLNGNNRRPIYKFHAKDSDNKGGNAIFFEGTIKEIISANNVAKKEIEKYEPHTLPILRDTTKGVKDKFPDTTTYGLRRYGKFTTTYNSKSERENNKRENDKTKQIHEKLSKNCPNDVAILYDYGIKVYIKKIKVIGKSIKGVTKVGNVEASRCDEANCFYNLMEYGNTVLEHYLKKNRYYIDAKKLLQICIILLKKIQNIHNEKVLHLDIKPNNIIMIEHENGEFYDGIKRYNLKFIDFGYSEIVGEDYQHIDVRMGTEGYIYFGINRNEGMDKNQGKRIYNRINDIYAIMRIFYKFAPKNLEQYLYEKASFFYEKGIVDQCNKIDFVKNCSEYFFGIFNILTYLITPFHQNIAITKEGSSGKFSSFPILDDTHFNDSSNPYRIETTEADGIRDILEYVNFLKVFGFIITPIEDFSYENRLNLLIEILKIYIDFYEYINELYDLFEQYCTNTNNQVSGTTMFQLLDVDDEREFHPNNPQEVLGFIEEIRSKV